MSAPLSSRAKRWRGGHARRASAYVGYIQRMRGTGIAEFFERWMTRGRRARTLEGLRDGVFPAAFPCGISRETDGEYRRVGVQYFPIAEAVSKVRGMQGYLQTPLAIVTFPGKVGVATPFIFAGARFAFDVLAPELEPLVDAAARYHRVKRAEFKAHREEKDFAAVIRGLAYHPLDEIETFDDWCIQYPFLDTIMRCECWEQATLESFLDELRDEFKRNLNERLYEHEISNHDALGEFPPQGVAAEWERLKREAVEGPFSFGVEPHFTRRQLFEYILSVQDERDLRRLEEMADWILIRLRSNPEAGSLRRRKQTRERYSNLAMALLSRRVETLAREQADRDPSLSARERRMNSTALRHEMYRHLFEGMKKLDTTDLFAALQRRPSVGFVPTLPSRLRPAARLLATLRDWVASGEDRHSAIPRGFYRPRGSRAPSRTHEWDGDDAADEREPVDDDGWGIAAYLPKTKPGFLTRSELARKLRTSGQNLRNLEAKGLIKFTYAKVDGREYPFVVDDEATLAEIRRYVRQITIEEFAGLVGMSARNVRRILGAPGFAWSGRKWIQVATDPTLLLALKRHCSGRSGQVANGE